jgi:prevent-host-death family protein
METLAAFSVGDLRTRSGDLLRDAELGDVAVITKHGRPAILAVPFDRQLLDLGVHRALALKLYEGRHLTMAQAAKLAGMPLDEFIDLLGAEGLAARRTGRLASIGAVLSALSQQHYRFSDALEHEVLRLAGRSRPGLGSPTPFVAFTLVLATYSMAGE